VAPNGLGAIVARRQQCAAGEPRPMPGPGGRARPVRHAAFQHCRRASLARVEESAPFGERTAGKRMLAGVVVTAFLDRSIVRRGGPSVEHWLPRGRPTGSDQQLARRYI
jgi:hypothetical protein